MSAQLTETTRVETAASATPDRKLNPLARAGLLVLALLVLLALPWLIYPPAAMDIAAWGLFAISVDLLLGFTGLLSVGHAMFWGTSVYVTGIIATRSGLPFHVAVLGGAVVAIIAVPTGYLAVRRTGSYFAMVTLAFAQMIFFIANQARDLTGGENGLQGIPKSFFGVELIETEPFYFYYAALPLILVGAFIAWRTVTSPSGGCSSRSVTTPPGPAPSATTSSATRSWSSSSLRASPGWPGECSR